MTGAGDENLGIVMGYLNPMTLKNKHLIVLCSRPCFAKTSGPDHSLIAKCPNIVSLCRY